MHYMTWVVIPDDERNASDAVAELMELHRENYDGGEVSGFWDWYLIGGSWAGSLVGAMPESPYTTHHADISTVREVLNGEPRTPFSIIWPGGVAHRETWNGDDWIETDEATHNRTVATVLLAHKDHRLVVVDYHS